MEQRADINEAVSDLKQAEANLHDAWSFFTNHGAELSEAEREDVREAVLEVADALAEVNHTLATTAKP